MKADKRNMTDETTNPTKGKQPMNTRRFDSRKLCELIDRRWGDNLTMFFSLLGERVPRMKPAVPLLKRWKAGSAPHANYLPALSELLGVKMDDLFREDEEIN